MADPMRKLLASTGDPKRARDEMFVVHETPLAGTTSQALAPEVRAMPWRDFLRDVMN
jgi:hypothetical protein